MTGALIVIPCLNEAQHLPGLLALIAADTGPDDIIVVADGGSRDESRAIVMAHAEADPRIRLMDNPAKIQSAGVNTAVRAFGAGRTFFLRIDAHCHYPPAYVSSLMAEAGRVAADSIVVAMRTEGTGCIQRAVAAAQNSRLGSGNSAHRVGAAAGFVDHGHHAVMRIDSFLKLGGYDETFSHNEDAEFDRRLTQAGGRIWLAGVDGPVYLPRATLPKLFRQYLNYGRGRAMTVIKHDMRLKLRQVAPAMIAPAAAGLLASPAVAALSVPLAVLAALPGLMWAAASLGFGAALAVKARDRCVLCAGLAAMTMHLAWSLGFLGRFAFAKLAAPPPPAAARLNWQAPAPLNTTVDICLCTFRRRSIAATLASLAALRLADGLTVRVIVADNDETDAARGFITATGERLGLSLTYVHAPARNISTARNAALDAATAPWVAILDDDEVASPEWLTALLAVQRFTRADVVLGPAVARYAPDVPRWIRDGDFHSARPVVAGGAIRTGYTSNVLFAREAPSLKGRRFDLALGRSGGEDTAFFHDAFTAGARIASAPEAPVFEEVTGPRATVRWLMRRKFRAGQSHAVTLETRGLSPRARAKETAVAAAKLAICSGAALAMVWSRHRFAAWALRAALHAGVVARLAGMEKLSLYGGDEAVA
ncbi:glycosyltransferase [Acuticoccus yangtzensis]|uniref:glycosyltransferase n=1 Tax=Acuticoccus yangtzensis TaxID=1443441 RepID=UPI000949A703